MSGCSKQQSNKTNMSFLKMENMKLYHIFSNKKIQILTENSIINFFLESVFFKNWLETPSNARIFNYLQKKKKKNLWPARNGTENCYFIPVQFAHRGHVPSFISPSSFVTNSLVIIFRFCLYLLLDIGVPSSDARPPSQKKNKRGFATELRSLLIGFIQSFVGLPSHGMR